MGCRWTVILRPTLNFEVKWHFWFYVSILRGTLSEITLEVLSAPFSFGSPFQYAVPDLRPLRENTVKFFQSSTYMCHPHSWLSNESRSSCVSLYDSKLVQSNDGGPVKFGLERCPLRQVDSRTTPVSRGKESHLPLRPDVARWAEDVHTSSTKAWGTAFPLNSPVAPR